MAYAALFLPEFPVTAWLRIEPEHRKQPLVVFDGAAPLEHVCACNTVAAESGVAHGMSRVQAETIGEILSRPRVLEQEAASFAAVMEVAGRFSPRVQAVRSPANGYGGRTRLAASILLDQTGTERLLGDRSRYAAELHAAVTSLGVHTSVTLARNAHTAMLLAKGTNGVTCIADHEATSRLAPLPVSVLELAEELETTFHRWGVKTLGQLAALPDTALISRMGQEARRLQRLARGEEEYVLVPAEAPLSIHEQVTLDTSINLLDSLLFVLSPMLERLLGRAREHAYAVRSLELVLALEANGSHTIEIRPAAPTGDRGLLLKLLHLELQARPPGAGVLAITLRAEPARPQVAQRGLFQAQFPEPQKLDLLLARLRSITGETSAGTPALANTHREDAFLITDFSPTEHPGRPALPDRQAGLALRRMRPPEAAQIQLREGAPALVHWSGLRLPVVEAFGPWQSSGAWWTTDPWTADEWDVVAGDPPQALRLYRERMQDRWYVAGVYD